MKLSTFAICFCAWLMAGLFFNPRTIKILRPDVLRPRIPVPKFTMNEIIRAMALKHRIKPAFVKSIMAAESGFQPAVVSPKGAIGLMQLMPATARELDADPNIPEQNVEAGAHYLSLLMARYDHKRDQMTRTIAAYNAGPGAVARFHGIPPFRETRKYVARVMKYFKKYQGSELAG
ncbi:MAG TPA: lytic transglycosylase domain-containing protein [Bryobacteraceae bacterium]|nr:lytic transglycosylase domain-containing protein [Bryobacteraceae bacterium]